MNNALAQRVTLWHPWPSQHNYDAKLVYNPADPYAITLKFPGTGGIAYTFARELLVDAAEFGDDTGHDAVRIRPSDDWLFIDLHAGEFPPLMMLRQSALLFLSLTYALVRVGDEAARIDWAAELAVLTGGAA